MIVTGRKIGKNVIILAVVAGGGHYQRPVILGNAEGVMQGVGIGITWGLTPAQGHDQRGGLSVWRGPPLRQGIIDAGDGVVHGAALVVMHLRAMILVCQLTPAMPMLLLPTAPMIPAMAVPWPLGSMGSPVLGVTVVLMPK